MAVDFNRNVFCILGLPFDAVDMSGAIQRIRHAAASSSACFISTPNLDWLIACRSDNGFRDSVVDSDLCLADGMPIVWIARLLGIPIRERVAGSNLFDALRHAPGQQLSVYFFGGPEGVAEAACKALSKEGKGLVCVGYESPGFGTVEEMSTDETVLRINASNADFLVVALGARKGQAWIQRNRARISTPVISHLGAVVNYVAGTVTRAPRWTQRMGLEWVWRIKEEPKLWRRYWGGGVVLCFLFLTRVVPYAWFLYRFSQNPEKAAAPVVEAMEESDHHVICLGGAWTSRSISTLQTCLSTAIRAPRDVTLDLSGVTYVDSAFIGLLVLMHGQQRMTGKTLRLRSVPKLVHKVLGYCCAEYLCFEPR